MGVQGLQFYVGSLCRSALRKSKSGKLVGSEGVAIWIERKKIPGIGNS